MAHAFGNGVRRVNLLVYVPNEPAVNLYRSLGFEPCGMEPEAVCLSGSYYDGVHMSLVNNDASPSIERPGLQELDVVMSEQLTIRPVLESDRDGWQPLWDRYNAFYGRSGPARLPDHVTQATWERFFDPSEPVRALVAEESGRLVGLAHYVFHRSTTRLHDVCYLQDLFTAEHLRRRGIARRLVEAVYEAARMAGSSRVYWQTQATNTAGRALYDKVAQHVGFIVYSHEL